MDDTCCGHVPRVGLGWEGSPVDPVKIGYIAVCSACGRSGPVKGTKKAALNWYFKSRKRKEK